MENFVGKQQIGSPLYETFLQTLLQGLGSLRGDDPPNMLLAVEQPDPIRFLVVIRSQPIPPFTSGCDFHCLHKTSTWVIGALGFRVLMTSRYHFGFMRQVQPLRFCRNHVESPFQSRTEAGHRFRLRGPEWPVDKRRYAPEAYPRYL